MIQKTDAIGVLERNLQRTEMLIEAMAKIKGYNRLYQMRQNQNYEDRKIVRDVQDVQLEQIEQSCGEHAIISLATAFETYYKELLQQVLCEYPNYFLSRHTRYSKKVNKLIEDIEPVTHEEIGQALKLRNRFDYYLFFEAYSILLLSKAEDQFIEYLYLRRNSYVHNAGGLDRRARKKLAEIPPPFDDIATSTEAKRLRTKLRKILYKSHDRLKTIVSQES